MSMIFPTILVDPAWSFRTWSNKGQGRSAEHHYSTMSIDDIKALPVESIAADDCALFMWAVDNQLPEAIEVGLAWGFTYKTVAFTWVKQVASRTEPNFLPVDHRFHWHTGMGYWSRSNPEMCLLFTRGKPQRLNKDVRQLIVAPVGEHSRKPDEIHERIERLVAGPYCELFARRPYPGWATFGNEIDGQDLAMALGKASA